MAKYVVVGILAILSVVGLAACESATSRDAAGRAPAPAETRVAGTASSGKGVPRLVDLGAGKCIPCKAMAPILDQLRSDYAGRLDVIFIDVWQRPEEARSYRINMIPTQIFYGADGRELARHEGFIDREQILARWKALGIEL
jgi:thioredoxin 1